MGFSIPSKFVAVYVLTNPDARLNSLPILGDVDRLFGGPVEALVAVMTHGNGPQAVTCGPFHVAAGTGDEPVSVGKPKPVIAMPAVPVDGDQIVGPACQPQSGEKH